MIYQSSSTALPPAANSPPSLREKFCWSWLKRCDRWTRAARWARRLMWRASWWRGVAGKITSVYLSSVSEYIKKHSSGVAKDHWWYKLIMCKLEELIGRCAKGIVDRKYLYPRWNAKVITGSSCRMIDSPRNCRVAADHFHAGKVLRINRHANNLQVSWGGKSWKRLEIEGLRCCRLPSAIPTAAKRGNAVFEGFKEGWSIPAVQETWQREMWTWRCGTWCWNVFTVGG